MEEINLDLNNLFNLSYNFEGLKILLTSIAKNQERMMEKIKKLENRQFDEKTNTINPSQIKNQIQSETNKIENQNKEIISNSSKEEKDISNNFIVTDLENRISSLETEYKNLRKFIPQYNESRNFR